MEKNQSIPYLIDSTLRDGEQAPRTAFTREEKLLLAQMLDETGIDEIEAGTPAMGEDVRLTIRQMCEAGLHARICVWSRALKADIDAAASTGATAIHIAFPLSEVQLKAMHKDEQWIEETLPEVLAYAQESFPYVSIGAQDASRSNPERLRRFVQMVASLHVYRIRLADTVGILNPLSTKQLIENVKSCCGSMLIDFHGHNDLGMATANTVTAWQCGADHLSVTVNGLGERAGNAALEEVVTALTLMTGSAKYHTEKLYDLCRFVARISDRPIPDGKPICGKMAVSHESGIHTQGTLSSVTAFQAFDGKIIGRESASFVFGKHSGRNLLIKFLKDHNEKVSDIQLKKVMDEIHKRAQITKKSVSPSEVARICKQVIQS